MYLGQLLGLMIPQSILLHADGPLRRRFAAAIATEVIE